MALKRREPQGRPRKRGKFCLEALDGELSCLYAVAVGEDKLRKHEVKALDVRQVLQQILGASAKLQLSLCALLVLGAGRVCLRKLELLEGQATELLARIKARSSSRTVLSSAKDVTLDLRVREDDLLALDVPALELALAEEPQVLSQEPFLLPEDALLLPDARTEAACDGDLPAPSSPAFMELTPELLRDNPFAELQLDLPNPDAFELAEPDWGALELAPPKPKRPRQRREQTRKRRPRPKPAAPEPDAPEPDAPEPDAPDLPNAPMDVDLPQADLELDAWSGGSPAAWSPGLSAPDIEEYRGATAAPAAAEAAEDADGHEQRQEQFRQRLVLPATLHELPLRGHKPPKAERAEHFLHLLALGARGTVELEQAEPYGAIGIQAGPRW